MKIGINMEIHINKRTNNAKIELSHEEEIRFLELVTLAKEFRKTRSIKTACDCTDEFHKLFVKESITNEN